MQLIDGHSRLRAFITFYCRFIATRPDSPLWACPQTPVFPSFGPVLYWLVKRLFTLQASKVQLTAHFHCPFAVFLLFAARDRQVKYSLWLSLLQMQVNPGCKRQPMLYCFGTSLFLRQVSSRILNVPYWFLLFSHISTAMVSFCYNLPSSMFLYKMKNLAVSKLQYQERKLIARWFFNLQTEVLPMLLAAFESKEIRDSCLTVLVNRDHLHF